MISSLQYKGDVKIKVQGKTSFHKNSGTKLLFETLIKWLSNQDINQEADRPKYLKVEKKNPYTGDITIISRDVIPVYPQFKWIEEEPCTVLTANILDSNLNYDSSEITSDKYYLCLYNGDTTDGRLASVEIDKNILGQISSGRQALIEWTLRIGNKEST